MKTINLSNNQVALVDDEDYERVSQYKWCASYNEDISGYYATNRINNTTWYMHRFIMGFPEGLHIDHIDKNTLNNQKSNLRTCTRSQNQCNRSKAIHNKSGYKGVWFDTPRNKWHAEIQLNGRKKHLGRFENIEDAARCYDAVAAQLHGEFACLNFPNEKDSLPYVNIEELFIKSNKAPDSKYRGVVIDKRKKKTNTKFVSAISYKSKSIRLGYFVSEIEAALAYDDVSTLYHGEKAYKNFPAYTDVCTLSKSDIDSVQIKQTITI